MVLKAKVLLPVAIVLAAPFGRGCEPTSAQSETITEIASDIIFPFHPVQLDAHRIIFLASTDETGQEPWVSDGTAEGTKVLKDILPGPADSTGTVAPPYFVVFRGEAFFFANDGVHGFEPWRTDGTEEGTELLADIIPGPEGFLSVRLVATQSAVFIFGNVPGEPGTNRLFVFERGR